jgi:hypothetical protein
MQLYRAKSFVGSSAELQAVLTARLPNISLKDSSLMLDLLSCWQDFTTIEAFTVNYARHRIGKRLQSFRYWPTRRIAQTISLRIHSCSDDVIQRTNTYDQCRRLAILALRCNLLTSPHLAYRAKHKSVHGTVLTIAIPTHSRPALLYRTLMSAIEAARQYDYDVKFVVSDDSTAICRSANVALLKRIAFDERRHIVYLGSDYKRKLKTSLTQLGCSAAAVNFCLEPRLDCGFGANRNALLLSCMGDLTLCCDDDVILRATSTAQREGVNCSKETVMRLNTISDVIVERRSFSDILGAHLNVLGISLRDLTANYSVDAKNACEHLTQRYQDGTGRIGYSLSGSYGDSGMNSDWPLLSVGERSDSISSSWRFVAPNLTKLCRSPVLRWFDGIYIGHSSAHVGMCYGQDLRTGCVPFFPHFRNEDGVMGRLSFACLPDLFWAYLPNAVEHAPEGPRPCRKCWEEGVISIRVSDLLLCLIETLDPRAERRSDDLFAYLGTEFMRIGSSSQKHYEERMGNVAALFWENRYRCLELVAKNRWLPFALLADSVECSLIKLKTLSQEKYCYRGTELAEESQPRSEDYQMRGYLYRFGELLAEWPAIVNASQASALRSLQASSILH